MLVLVVKDALVYNSVNRAMTNANIETAWQGSESSFISFLMIVLNLKDLKPSVKYIKKVTKDIA